jgi:hypothetical protein
LVISQSSKLSSGNNPLCRKSFAAGALFFGFALRCPIEEMDSTEFALAAASGASAAS